MSNSFIMIELIVEKKECTTQMKILRNIVRLLIFCILGGYLLFMYATKIEPYTFVTRHYTLGDKKAKEQLKIVQISDIQISENYTARDFNKIVDKINSLEPDLFLFTGDLYENYASYGKEKDLIQALKRIETKYGKFAIWGNRDYGGGAGHHYKRILNTADIQLLENSGVHILLESGQPVFLAGIDDSLLGNPRIKDIEATMCDEDNYRILMTHEPDIADDYAESGFDLILSGHSHGGQIWLPFIEPITTSMAQKYTKGFYNLTASRGTKLYVNSGIGTSHYPIRFLVPPEIAVFHIGF